MYTDLGLELATAEDLATLTTAGAIGPDSITKALQPGGVTEALRQHQDLGSGHLMSLMVNVNTAFTPANFGDSLEISLISLPISASLLDASGAITGGKGFSVASVPVDVSEDEFDITGHGLARGTPLYLTALATATGVALNTIFYAIPTSANSFQVATSLDNALAGTQVAIGGSDGTATIVFLPTVHASSGQLPMFDAGVPAIQGPLADAGETSLYFPIRPVSQATGKVAVTDGTSLQQPMGAGSELGLIGDNANQHYYIYYKPTGGTIAAGAVTINLVLCNTNSLFYGATSHQFVG